VETIPGAVAAIVGSSTTRYYSDAPHYFILCDQNLAPAVERLDRAVGDGEPLHHTNHEARL
jgi:hypothetical protein